MLFRPESSLVYLTTHTNKFCFSIRSQHRPPHHQQPQYYRSTWHQMVSRLQPRLHASIMDAVPNETYSFNPAVLPLSSILSQFLHIPPSMLTRLQGSKWDAIEDLTGLITTDAEHAARAALNAPLTRHKQISNKGRRWLQQQMEMANRNGVNENSRKQLTRFWRRDDPTEVSLGLSFLCLRKIYIPIGGYPVREQKQGFKRTSCCAVAPMEKAQ